MNKEWIDAFLTMGVIGGISLPIVFWVINYWKIQKVKIIESSVGEEAVKNIKAAQSKMERDIENMQTKIDRNTDKATDLQADINDLLRDSRELNLLIRKAFFKENLD